MIDLALQLVGRGYHVFPCSISKKPLTEHGLLDASNDAGQINLWWSKWPEAQIGINCERSNLCVLDLDDPATLEIIKEKYPELMNTRRIRTGRGGAHLYFKMPGTIKIKSTTKKIKELPSSDTRAYGGYVISEGSKNENGPYTVENDVEVLNIPDSLMVLFFKNEVIEVERRAPVEVVKVEPKANGVRTPGPDYWVDKYSSEASEGNRNKMGAKLAAQLKAEDITERQAETYMLRFQRNVDRSGNPYTEKEALNTLHYVYTQYGTMAPVVLSDISEPIPGPRITEPEITHPTIKPFITPEPYIPMMPEKEPELLHYMLTDSGNAERIEAMYGDALRYCHEMGKWLIWNGLRWRPDCNDTIYQVALDTIRAAHSQAVSSVGDNRKERIQFFMNSENRSGLSNMIDMAKTRSKMKIKIKELDLNKHYFNVRNGTINLKTGNTQAHDKLDYITRLCDIEYNKCAEMPKDYADFLDITFCSDTEDDKKEMIAFLQRAIGYSLTGESGQYLFILHGGGKNNKSTFYLIFQKMLGIGEYADQVQPDTFLVKMNRDDKRNDLAALCKVRFVVTSEPHEGARLDEGIVKQITGGDPIKCRFLRQEFFTYYPEFKPWYVSNHKPRITGTDNGIRSRILYIEFKVKVLDELQKRGLPRIDYYENYLLSNYAPAILKWAVDGAVQYYNGGLKAPKRVKDSTEAYLNDQDIVQRWVNDRCDVSDPEATEKFSDLYEDYKVWSEGEGENVFTQRTFATKLTDKGYDKARSNATKYRKGIKLRPKDSSEEINKNDNSNNLRNKEINLNTGVSKVGTQNLDVFNQSVTKNIKEQLGENSEKVTDVTVHPVLINIHEGNPINTSPSVTSVTKNEESDRGTPILKGDRLIDVKNSVKEICDASDKRHYEAIIMEIDILNEKYNKAPVLWVIDHVHEKGFGRDATEKEIRRLMGIGEIDLDNNGNLKTT